MKKILCITTGSTGMLNSSFKLVSLLERAGYDVTYGCPWDVRDSVTKQGFKYIQLNPINFDPAPELPMFHGPLADLRRFAYGCLHAKERRHQALESLRMESFSAILSDLKPDLVLIDLELHDYILTAVSSKVPTALLISWFSIWKRPNLPPISYARIPGKSWRGSRIGIELSWARIRLTRITSILKSRISSAFTDRASILRCYARSVGFPNRELTELYDFPPPLSYRTLPVISMTARELEFPHTSRPNLHYVGPMVYADRDDQMPDFETRKELDRIFKAKVEEGFKVIYCSITTMRKGNEARLKTLIQRDEAFLKRVVEAVSNCPTWHLILGLGGLEKDFLSNIPANVHPFSWVPQIRALEFADCAISHGGINTINECIHFSVPMLFYSGKRFDQNGCAARIAYHRLGVMADKDIDDAQMIRSRLETILQDKDALYKRRFDDLKTRLKKYEHSLGQVVETLMNSD